MLQKWLLGSHGLGKRNSYLPPWRHHKNMSNSIRITKIDKTDLRGRGSRCVDPGLSNTARNKATKLMVTITPIYSSCPLYRLRSARRFCFVLLCFCSAMFKFIQLTKFQRFPIFTILVSQRPIGRSNKCSISMCLVPSGAI